MYMYVCSNDCGDGFGGFYRALFAKETYNFKEPTNRENCCIKDYARFWIWLLDRHEQVKILKCQLALTLTMENYCRGGF